uniref:Uncharacterized protein n=1 Tax=Magallana gigas TaxID=29159 RepID=A0A8W8MK81_MAGGI
MHADAARITLDEPDNQPSLEASAERKRKPTRASSEGNYMQQLLEVEEQKLEIAKEKLEIKKRRLAIDEQRLALDQQKFQLELQRHQVYWAKYCVTFSVTDQNQ